MSPVNSRWIEAGKPGGGRLSPAFFTRGATYIVIADDKLPGVEEPGDLSVTDASQIWRATRRNVAMVEKMLREAAEK
jgi:predicted transcriptional regulator